MRARFHGDNIGVVARCAIGINGCSLVFERRWTPLSRTGNRIGVLEELFQPPPLIVGQRGNFHEIQAPPP